MAYNSKYTGEQVEEILDSVGGKQDKLTAGLGITINDETNVISLSDDAQLLTLAWGVPIKQSVQSSPDWGRVGNLDMWEAYKAKTGRYLLSRKGKKMAKLDKNNSTVFADGTELDETKGHTMWYAPRLYYLVRDNEAEGIPYLWLSELPISGHYIGYTLIGAYKAYLDSDNCLTSRSGVKPTCSHTITQFWNYAQNNGEDFGLVDYDARRLMVMLLLSEFGNTNSQEMIGYGACGSTQVDWQTEVNDLLTGATATLGDNSGKIDIESEQGYSPTDPSRVSQLGVEDAWGFQSEMTQGVYFGNSGNDGQDGTEIFIYEGNRMPSDDELATHPEGNYRQLTRDTTSSYQYVKEMILGEFFDMFLKTAGGGSNENWCDAQYGSTTGQLCQFGGRANCGPLFGLVYVYSNNAFSHSDSHYGSRLAYYGEMPEIVSGAELVEYLEEGGE